VGTVGTAIALSSVVAAAACGARTSVDGIEQDASGAAPWALSDGGLAGADGSAIRDAYEPDATTSAETLDADEDEAAADAGVGSNVPGGDAGGSADGQADGPADGGACQSACVPGARVPQIVTTVSGLGPLSITADSTSVYWLGPSVGKVPLAGGSSTVLTTTNANGIAGQIVLGNGALYWVDTLLGTTVNEVPLGGGASIQLASSPGNAARIAVDATTAYWSDDQGTIRSVRIAGGTPSILASTPPSSSGNLQSTGTVPTAIAIDATTLYWTDAEGGLYSVPLGGGAATQLVADEPLPANTGVGFWVSGIVLDADNVYWTYCPAGSTTSGAVRKVAKAGGPVIDLVSGQDCPSSLAIDVTSVYWIEYREAKLMKTALASGDTTVLATCQPYSMVGPVVDSTSVYWATNCPGDELPPTPGGPPIVGSPNVMGAIEKVGK
jgi:hypothetical protein